jgi:GGDEF domain-containing protein
MSSIPDSPSPEPTQDQSALTCYLGAVVAIGNCVADVYPAAGLMYRDRLLKLPRRLGFDPTPKALQHSLEAVETDLIEFSAIAGAWVRVGLSRAAQLSQHLRATEEMLIAAADLQQAFLADLAEHMEASAEVDEEAQLRRAFHRYASGLRAYSRRTNTEKLAAIEDLRRRREEIEFWLAEADVSDFLDHETGLLNRLAGERRLRTEIGKNKPFCALLVDWVAEVAIPETLKETVSGQITRQLADRLAATIRPYDVIFRWSENQLLTVFEAPESGVTARSSQIAAWLGDESFAVEVAGEASVIKARPSVSLVEHLAEESAVGLIGRIEAVANNLAASSR